MIEIKRRKLLIGKCASCEKPSRSMVKVGSKKLEACITCYERVRQGGDFYVPFRRRNEARAKISAKVLSLHAAGKSRCEIAREVKTSATTVYRMLVRAGSL